MLKVLLESRAPRSRRIGSTAASALVHAALIAAAVALTLPRAVDANGAETPQPPIVYVPLPDRPPVAASGPAVDASPAPGPVVPPTIALPDVAPTTIPPVEVELPAIPLDRIAIGGSGARTGSAGDDGELPSSLRTAGAAIDARLVDRVPRLLGGAPQPRYPASLRDAGVQGRVVVQFVVDTLGRAELGELQVMETPHPLFVEAVRAALARYRFSVGEAGGRRVRTRVQLPFEFALTR